MFKNLMCYTKDFPVSIFIFCCIVQHSYVSLVVIKTRKDRTNKRSKSNLGIFMKFVPESVFLRLPRIYQGGWGSLL